MKQIYCKFCGLELEKGSCVCESSLDAAKLEKMYVQKIKCDTCGKKIDINSNFCPFCGVEINVDGKNAELQKELRGEYAQDVLEKYNIKKKRSKKDGLIIVSKILTVILFIVLIILLFIKLFLVKKDDKNVETTLQESITETQEIQETQETQKIEEKETQSYIEIKDKWIKQDGYYYCFDEEGEPVIDDWVEVEDENGKIQYYYFDTDGKLVVNSWIDGEYYVGNDGAMYVDRDTPDGARVDENGKVIINEEVEKIPVIKETYVYYEAPNSNETIVPSSQKSGSSGVIKGVDSEKTYELYIKSLVQERDVVVKENNKCNIIFYCPVIVGAKDKEVSAINEELINIFNDRMKNVLRGKAEQFNELPKSIILNIYEQRNINENRFMFLASGKIVPRSGLSEKIKFRFTYDRKSKKIAMLEIKEK